MPAYSLREFGIKVSVKLEQDVWGDGDEVMAFVYGLEDITRADA